MSRLYVVTSFDPLVVNFEQYRGFRRKPGDPPMPDDPEFVEQALNSAVYHLRRLEQYIEYQEAGDAEREGDVGDSGDLEESLSEKTLREFVDEGLEIACSLSAINTAARLRGESAPQPTLAVRHQII
jgi:hypothetical protein